MQTFTYMALTAADGHFATIVYELLEILYRTADCQTWDKTQHGKPNDDLLQGLQNTAPTVHSRHRTNTLNSLLATILGQIALANTILNYQTSSFIGSEFVACHVDPYCICSCP